MNLTQKVTINFIFQLVGKALAIVLGILAISFLTRYLGRGGFGEYSTIITFASFFAAIADLGIYLIATREISKNHERASQITSNVFTLRTVTNLFFLILTPIVALFFPYSSSLKIGILIGAFAYFFVTQNQVLIGIFQKQLRVDKIVIADVVGKLFFAIFILIAIKFSWSLNIIIWGFVLSNFANFVLSYIFALKYVKIRFTFDWPYWKFLIKEAWPLALAIIFSLIYFKSDILILSIFKSAQEVGIYGAPSKISEALTSFPAILLGILFPLLSQYAYVDTARFKKVFQNAFDVLSIVVFPMVLGTWVLAKPIMNILGGSEFTDSAFALKILMIANGIIFMAFLSSYTVIALGKQKNALWANGLAAILSLVLNFIFIPRFSYIAAAFTAILSQLAAYVFLNYIIYKYARVIPNFKITLKSVFASVAMAAFLVFFSSWNFWLLLGCGSAVYFIILFVLRGLPREAVGQMMRVRK